MSTRKLVLVLPFLMATVFAVPTPGLKPDDVHVASPRKMGFYIADGIFVGGDRAVNDVVVLSIRHAMNAGFERLVLDMEGNRLGEAIAIERPPYYHVAVTSDMKRLVLTVWGKPKLVFDAKKVMRAFKKSKYIKTVDLLPAVEKERWTFSVNLKKNYAVEVFELANPVRVVVDIKDVRI